MLTTVSLKGCVSLSVVELPGRESATNGATSLVSQYSIAYILKTKSIFVYENTLDWDLLILIALVLIKIWILFLALSLDFAIFINFNIAIINTIYNILFIIVSSSSSPSTSSPPEAFQAHYVWLGSGTLQQQRAATRPHGQAAPCDPRLAGPQHPQGGLQDWLHLRPQRLHAPRGSQCCKIRISLDTSETSADIFQRCGRAAAAMAAAALLDIRTSDNKLFCYLFWIFYKLILSDLFACPPTVALLSINVHPCDPRVTCIWSSRCFICLYVGFYKGLLEQGTKQYQGRDGAFCAENKNPDLLNILHSNKLPTAALPVYHSTFSQWGKFIL